MPCQSSVPVSARMPDWPPARATCRVGVGRCPGSSGKPSDMPASRPDHLPGQSSLAGTLATGPLPRSGAREEVHAGRVPTSLPAGPRPSTRGGRPQHQGGRARLPGERPHIGEIRVSGRFLPAPAKKLKKILRLPAGSRRTVRARGGPRTALRCTTDVLVADLGGVNGLVCGSGPTQALVLACRADLPPPGLPPRARPAQRHLRLLNDSDLRQPKGSLNDDQVLGEHGLCVRRPWD